MSFSRLIKRRNGGSELNVVVVVLPGLFRRMGHGGTPQRPNSWATPQGLDQRSKMGEVVLKMACWKGSDAGQLRRR